MTCTHEKRIDTWVPDQDNGWYVEPAHWDYETTITAEDLDLGRFRCRQCGAVGYYTGLWRAFHEERKPCTGSEGMRPAGVPEKRW